MIDRDMPNPQLLVRFAAVAQHLSFSAAAAKLGVDQAWLSRQIRQLEQELGVRLFARTTRAVSLTNEGENLLPVALDVVQAHERAKRAMDSMMSDNAAVLRIGTHPYVYWSPQMRAILTQFSTETPGTQVQTLSGTSARHIMHLRSGMLDAALITDATLPDNIETLPVMRVKPNLLLPLQHPLAGHASLTLRELGGLSIAIASAGREMVDFNRVYRPFFAHGAEAITITEGPTAVVYFATNDKLAMISLRPISAQAPEGFVRRAVDDAPEIDFLLARAAKSADRALPNRFWQSAKRTAARVHLSD